MKNGKLFVPESKESDYEQIPVGLLLVAHNQTLIIQILVL